MNNDKLREALIAVHTVSSRIVEACPEYRYEMILVGRAVKELPAPDTVDNKLRAAADQLSRAAKALYLNYVRASDDEREALMLALSNAQDDYVGATISIRDSSPTPVDDKALAEALHISLEEMLDTATMERIGVSKDRDINSCVVRVCGELRALQDALRAAQQELEDLRADRDTWKTEAEARHQYPNIVHEKNLLTQEVAELRKDKERLRESEQRLIKYLKCCRRFLPSHGTWAEDNLADIDSLISATQQSAAGEGKDPESNSYPHCTYTLRSQGKPYPRTCQECGLGPCKKGMNSAGEGKGAT